MFALGVTGVGDAGKQVADAWCALEQFKLLVLRTAWLIDRTPGDYTGPLFSALPVFL